MLLDSILKIFFGTKNERDVKALLPIVDKINEKEKWAKSLDADGFLMQTAKFKTRLEKGETLDDILPEAFALVREASFRKLGERHYDVQLMGSLVLHSGRIVEMKTGEGKTLMCVAAAYLNSLVGKGVHIVTVNDYLAERDANWMRPVYEYLGVTVGIIVAKMDNDARKRAYACDITYGTNNELGFDYLRDNMQISLSEKVQRGFPFCIVDEIDSILIDEARTPLIISGAGINDTAKYYEVNQFVGYLEEVQKLPDLDIYPDEVQGQEVIGDYKLDEKNRKVSFTDAGMLKIEQLLQHKNIIQGSLFEENNFEYVHYVTQAVRAHKLYHINVDYLVQDKEIKIVDEFTGRVLEGRRYGDGLHQAIEAKENIKVAQRNRTMATITFQNFFRMYTKLSGMTGTADTEAVEFNKIYNLDVVVIPTNKPIARVDENDEVFLNETDKWNSICKEIVEVNKKGQPILVGTVSVEKSELLSNFLTRRGVRHEVLNAKNHAREALIIAEAGAKGSVTIATNMAGRGTDIKLGGNPEFRATKRCGTDATPEEFEAAFAIEKENWKKDYEEVKSLGGLYVIGTERNESRRIDNQLRGRSGRQGDPGRSKFFISMDDDLMRLFGGEKMKAVMGRIGMSDGEPIYHPMLTKGIEKAQSKVEERNFEIRKHLLDYDDVLNEQRNFIYSQRDEILADTKLTERVLNATLETLDDAIDIWKDGAKKISTKDDADKNFAETLKNIFSISQNKISEIITNGQKYLNKDDILKNELFESLKDELAEKESLAGHENFNMFIRYQYIQAIDKAWLNHLEVLEGLREAVHLRSYGSKNPLTEYKIDGYNIFYDMIESIRLVPMRSVFHVKVQREEEGRKVTRGRPIAQTNAQHIAFDAQAAVRAAASSPYAAHRQGEGVTIVRTGTKVGRNDPCPCGSGKKYKQCCGR